MWWPARQQATGERSLAREAAVRRLTAGLLLTAGRRCAPLAGSPRPRQERLHSLPATIVVTVRRGLTRRHNRRGQTGSGPGRRV